MLRSDIFYGVLLCLYIFKCLRVIKLRFISEYNIGCRSNFISANSAHCPSTIIYLLSTDLVKCHLYHILNFNVYSNLVMGFHSISLICLQIPEPGPHFIVCYSIFYVC